jgi:hypothetical protein
MLELTPPSAPGERHGRVSVFVMEPGGSLWLYRLNQRRQRMELLLIPRAQLPRLRNILAGWRPERGPLRLVRQTTLGSTQRLTVPATDLDRVREAIRELIRFEATPDLPEWKERGYLTKEEGEAIAAAHPEWFPEEDDPDAGPEPG